jgi:hypothetical protein
LITLVCIEGLALLVLAVLVAGLLRSHADILRALHALGVDVDGPPGRQLRRHTAAPQPSPITLAANPRTADGTALGLAEVADLVGVNPRGDAVHVAVTGVRHDTLLAFMTTGCSTCHSFWAAFRANEARPPGDARLVAVVHDALEESISKLQDLAPPDITVVMSTPAWEAYGVKVAPYFVYVSGSEGRVVGEGWAKSWPEVVSLVEQARADRMEEAGAATARHETGQHRRGQQTSGRGSRPRDADRASRVDAELMAAGIAPGDSRLYPTEVEVRPPEVGRSAG